MRGSFSLYNLNKELLESGIGIVAAQHLEGGLEALLYLKTDNFEDVVASALLFFARRNHTERMVAIYITDHKESYAGDQT